MRDATRPADGAAVPGVDTAPRPSLARSTRRRARRRTVALATAGAVVLCGVGGGVALALGGDGTGRYRTATAEIASVEQSVDAVGSVASATRRDASFSVAGTVATVDVAVGQQVAAGQTLATLDTASLQGAVDDAEASLADAQDQLDADLASQTSSSTDETAAPSGTTSPTGTVTPSPSTDPTDDSSATRPDGSDTSADPAVQAAVAAVRTAQENLLAQAAAAHDALAASSSSVEASRAACTAFLDLVADDEEPQPTPSTPTEPPTEPSTDPTGAATGAQVVPEPATDVTDDEDGDDTAVTAALAACQDAISGTLDTQEATDAAQQALTALAATLDEAVARLREVVTQALAGEGTKDEPTDAGPTTGGTVDSSRDTTGTTGTSTTGTTATDPSTTSDTRPDGSDTTSGVASAATILADQAAVAAAQAEVAVAQAALPFGTLTSPIAGTVAAVSLAPGDTVGASSSTAVVTVLAGDGHTVTTTVGLADIDLVSVGQTASVTTPSTDARLTGTVSSIGVLDVSTTSEPSYTVEIALDATQERLFDGASAQVVVQVAGVDDVLTVPTSAVRTADGATTVQVLDGDAPTTAEVEVGAVGAERTEIVSGLSEGDEVVLADLDQPVEGASGSTSTGLSGLGDDQRGPVVIQGGPPAGFQGGPPSTRTGG